MQYYKVIFEGISTNITEETANENLVKLFKLSPEKASKLLATPGATVKRNITKPKARELKLALAKISVHSRIEEDQQATPPPKKDLATAAALQQIKLDTQATNCPKCNEPSTQSDSCHQCGLIFAKYEAQQAADPRNKIKRYGIAAAEEKHQQSTPPQTESPKSNLRTPLVAMVILMCVGVMAYSWNQDSPPPDSGELSLQELEEQRSKLGHKHERSGIVHLSIDKVDSLQALAIPGEITIVDFYDERCGSCNRRSDDLQSLVQKVPSAKIRRFNISRNELHQKAQQKYQLFDVPVRHARIYDESGKLRLVDRSEEDRPASKLIHRWAFFGESPYIPDDL